MGNASKHFDWQEFFREEDQTPENAGKVSPLLLERLEAIRDFFGQPIRITSGWRNPERNAAAGGASKSQHLNIPVVAADFVVGEVHHKIVQDWIREQGWTGGLGLGKTFTHYDVRDNENLVEWSYG